MSDFDEATSHFNIRIEKLSSEELEEMLRYSTFSDMELDVNQIQLILSELERRELQAAISTPEAAWEVFKRDYSGKESDYLSCAFKEKKLSHDNTVDHDPPRSSRTTSTRHRRPIVKVAIVAAVVAALLMGATVTASALGYDLWGAIATWTRETFGFSAGTSVAQSNADSSSQQPHPEFAELKAALNEYGVKLNLLPSYLPDGFELDEMYVDEMDGAVSFTAALVNDGDTIIFSYKRTKDPIELYEKDEADPIVYKAGGIDHYIFTNMGVHCAAWINGNFECSVSGVDSKDELTKLLNSIYER